MEWVTIDGPVGKQRPAGRGRLVPPVAYTVTGPATGVCHMALGSADDTSAAAELEVRTGDVVEARRRGANRGT